MATELTHSISFSQMCVLHNILYLRLIALPTFITIVLLLKLSIGTIKIDNAGACCQIVYGR